MKMIHFAIVLGFALGACGGGEKETTAEPETEGQASFAEPMTEAVEKAKAVEDQVMQHKEAIDEAVEAAEDADEPSTDE
ncbi:MAG TPA: hypothetical protein VE175_16275 [Woeseiaceae bacterium]|jgi:hypothetical protein|nr:hypothetical protein [Woeseiaceae bacterium]